MTARSLLAVAGIASQWTAAAPPGDPSGTIRPTSDVSKTPTGMDGGWADLDDDPDSPDGNWLLRPQFTRNTTQTDCTFGLAAPTGTPGGTDAQQLKVLLRSRDRDGATGNNQDALVTLYVDGTAVATDLTQTAAAETVHSASFDDSVSSGWSTIEVRVQQTTNGGGGPDLRSYIEIGAIEINWSAT